MTVNANDLRQLLQFAIELVDEAGSITSQYFKRSIATQRKADNSFVTIADREAEQHIRARIAQAFPDDGILGEEEGERIGTSGRRWIVDPIDGTYSFVHGVPLYAILLGVEIEDEPVAGIVNLPELKEMVSAARGLGCFLNGEPAHVSSTPSLDQSLLLCTDFGSCERYGLARACAKLQCRVEARRTWGDAYGHVLVATGRADIMLDPVMNIWDCAALAPIVEEAGGTFTNWRGERTINGGNAISTNGKLFDEVMTVIKGKRSSSCW